MVVASLALITGLLLLVWSADRFVEGAAASAYHFGLSPLLIGMVIVGFGTSAPEMVVSALAAIQGNPGIALGNAIGSNIANLALILGLTALIHPIIVQSSILRKELPVITIVTIITAVLMIDRTLSRLDAGILLFLFAVMLFWSIRQGMMKDGDSLVPVMEVEATNYKIPLGKAGFLLLSGLLLLIISSRILVWGAVEIAIYFGVTDMIIGLTIVAFGTSMPELASSLAAVRKGEHEIALGNILGSYLFNILAVIGIAGAIKPVHLELDTLHRDMPVMGALTLSLFVIGYGFRGRQGRINRFEGAVLISVYIGYTVFLIRTIVGT